MGFDEWKSSVFRSKLKIKFTAEMKKKCIELVAHLMELPSYELFKSDLRWDDLVDYRKVIEKPSSLTTLRNDMTNGKILYFEEFIFELRMIFNNCYIYYYLDKAARKKAVKALELTNSYINKTVIAPLVHLREFKQEDLNLAVKFNLELNKDWKDCKQILTAMIEKKSAFSFMRPIHKYGTIFDQYDEIVKRKMDLGTISSRLFFNYYKNTKEFVRDIKLVYDNCIKYYKARGKMDSFLVKEASECLKHIEKLIKRKFTKPTKLPPPPPPVKQTNLQDLGIAMSPDVYQRCEKILNKLIKDKNCFFFLEKVDHVALNLPDYPEIVKQPMDLSTVKRKLVNKLYPDVNSYVADIQLIFSNCLLYNKQDFPNFPIRKMCRAASAKFLKLTRDLANDFLKGEFKQTKAKPKVENSLTIDAQKLKMLLVNLINNYLSTNRKEKKSFTEISQNVVKGEFKTLKEFVTEVEKRTKDKFSLKLFKSSFSQSILFLDNNLISGSDVHYDRAKVRIVNKTITETSVPHKNKETPSKPTIVPPPPPSPPPPSIKAVIHKVDKKPVAVKPPEVKSSTSRYAAFINLPEKKQQNSTPKTPDMLKKKENMPKKVLQNTPTPIKDLSREIRNIKAFPDVEVSGTVLFPKAEQENEKKNSRQALEEYAYQKGMPVFKPPSRPDKVVMTGFLSSVEKVLLKLSKHDYSKLFFGIPVLDIYTDKVFQKNYKSIVEEPMDLYTIFMRLYSTNRVEIYKDANDILTDIKLIYQNAIQFNSLNEEIDEAAKMTKLYAQHMLTYSTHLFHERDAGYQQSIYNNLILKFAQEGKLHIDFDQLFCFCFDGRDKATKQLTDPEIDRFRRPKISDLIDKQSEDYLDEINLFLYIDYNDVINFNSLPEGLVQFNEYGPVSSEQKILWDERKRRLLRSKLRAEREGLVEMLSVYETRAHAHILKILSKLTNPNKRALNAFFLQPFDYRAVGLLSYPDIVKHPMDFQTIRSKLENGRYKTVKEFIRDVRLIFHNCLLFTRTNANDFNIKLRKNCIRFSRFFEKLVGDFTLTLLEKNSRMKVEKEVDKFQRKLALQAKKEYEAQAQKRREKNEKRQALLFREQNPNAVFQPTRVNEHGIILKTKLNKSHLEKRRKAEQKRRQKELEQKLINDSNWAISLAHKRAEAKLILDREKLYFVEDTKLPEHFEFNLPKKTKARTTRRLLENSLFGREERVSEGSSKQAETRKRKLSSNILIPNLDAKKLKPSPVEKDLKSLIEKESCFTVIKLENKLGSYTLQISFEKCEYVMIEIEQDIDNLFFEKIFIFLENTETPNFISALESLLLANEVDEDRVVEISLKGNIANFDLSGKSNEFDKIKFEEFNQFMKRKKQKGQIARVLAQDNIYLGVTHQKHCVLRCENEPVQATVIKFVSYIENDVKIGVK